MTRPEPALAPLEAFVGQWTLEGRQHEGPVGPAADISGTESFEWLAGGRFLVHRFDARVGSGPAACIEITGHDPATGGFVTHTYYDNGQTNDWQLREHDDTWTLTGEWPMPSAPSQVRCTTTFGDGGRTRTARWESSGDGASWQTFWDVTSTR